MKNLKLFPKIFLYTLILMLLIAFFASGMIYLLAPIIASSDPLSPGLAQDIPGIAAATIPRNEVITKAILGSLPYTIGLCVILSLLCAFFFSRAITKPIKNMLLVTQQMATLEKNAACSIQSGDEIGILSRSINELYQKLLFTIEHLREEKDKVSEVERQKVDFLRAASHELKTPVTALNATLENMIMEVGKYKDYNTYLPLCKEQTEQIGKMVTEILDASKLSASISSEETQSFDIANYLKELCGQYQLISNANDVVQDALSGGECSDPLEFWEISEYENWMKTELEKNQKLADSGDVSFYAKDANDNYICRAWTQADVDLLYEQWQEQLLLMKQGYHFAKTITLPDGGLLTGAFDPETWNAKPSVALGSTIITMPDKSTVDLGHFDTAEEATQAVKKYLAQQVKAELLTQAEADKILSNAAVE